MARGGVPGSHRLGIPGCRRTAKTWRIESMYRSVGLVGECVFPVVEDIHHSH